MVSFFEKLKGAAEIENLEQKPSSAKASEDKEKSKKIKPPIPSEETEGQLAIDVYETNGDLVIQSTIAGVRAEDLDISIENDIVTIRGQRPRPVEQNERKFFYQECYWGPFSRQVILPEEVDGSRAEAAMKDGVLTLKMPKIQKKKKRKIVVKQEE